MNSNHTQQADLVSLMAGELDIATLAARHGITEAEALRWREIFVAGMRASASGQSMVRRPRHRLVMVGAAMLATAAFAQLVTFNADEPALASAVNGNFTQLKNWLEAKVGPVTSTDLTTPGRVSAQAFAPAYADWNTVSTGFAGGAGLVNDNGTFRALMIVGNNAKGGSVRNVDVFDDLRVTRNATVSNDLTVLSNTWASGPVDNAEMRFTTSGTPLQWSTCTNGQYVCGVGVGNAPGDVNFWTGARLAVRCCSL